MEKTRTLPPLVRGRVTGVLDIFVEEIRLRNIFLAVDNFDLILQVQWWGEDSPMYLRPKKGCCQQTRIKTGSDLVGTARYEIKTALDLFKLYLETSQVLELCILDALALDDWIIGSAFLKDLVKLLNERNEIIKLPIFDYLGEEIGEIAVIFNFLANPWPNSNEGKDGEMTAIDGNEFIGKSVQENFYVSDKSTENYSGHFTLPEKIFFHDRNKLRENKGLTKKFQPFKSKDLSNENKKTGYVSESSEKAKAIEKSSSKCLPEITVSSDSSKVLYFGLNSQKSRPKSEGSSKTGVTNKFNSNSIKFKSKKKGKTDSSHWHSSVNGKEFKKSSGAPVNSPLHNIPFKLKEMKQSQVSVANKSVQSEEHLNCFQSPAKSIPSQETLKTKVLDYLLGSDLSKEDEESAVNELKKMSPSHNLVTSINKLCLTSDGDSFKSENKYSRNSGAFIQSHCLNFNLNDPIERSYYEKFFLKSNPIADLELAEFLNQPENRIVLEDLKSKESMPIKGCSSNSSSKSSKVSLCGKEISKMGSEEKFLERLNGANATKDCAQCKYHKKLEELDTIIESLKHFEKKMLLHEKDLTSKLEGSTNAPFNGRK